MKKTIIILVIAFIAGGCMHTNKQQAANNSVISPINSAFASDIRPNEKLQLNKIYTDEFEFIDYNDDYDDFFIEVQKDNKKHSLIVNDIRPEDLNLNRGDMVRIQWKINSLRPSGDESLLLFEEFATEITKIKDSNVSLFRQKHPKPLKYYYNNDYSISFLDKIYKNVEYYIANSKQDLVKLAIYDPKSDLIYSIEDRTMNGKKYYAVGISNEFENIQSIIQWIYLDEDLQKIFEYDISNNELIEFE